MARTCRCHEYKRMNIANKITCDDIAFDLRTQDQAVISRAALRNVFNVFLANISVLRACATHLTPKSFPFCASYVCFPHNVIKEYLPGSPHQLCVSNAASTDALGNKGKAKRKHWHMRFSKLRGFKNIANHRAFDCRMWMYEFGVQSDFECVEFITTVPSFWLR
ncbi:hypothetical protein RB195_025531 [Necator americanus]|uniref:Uncharacterized protein n=1 Tax=Necator americanus TaxID=51031 RepID=A0ABR1ESR0_NECAM